jgi:hypothetical protein
MLVYFTAPGALLIVTPRCTISVVNQQAEPFVERRLSRLTRHCQPDGGKQSPQVSEDWKIAQLTDRGITCLENIDVHYVKYVTISS